MAANYPGAGKAVPSTAVDIRTLIAGISVPAGIRTMLLMGEGAREEIIVSNANGEGNDGLDPTYNSTTGSDGRHFLLGAGQAVAPLIENRTRLFKNGIELTVLEGTITGSTFDSRFDVKVDPATGEIELQPAYLVDQGGALYSASSSNVGDGTISNLELIDPNAPAETWSVRCTTVRRDGYGNPIDGYAIFVVRGTVSGSPLDGYGNQITWQSNGTITDNGILKFAINEGTVAFREGDSFTIQVAGGSLISGDELSAIYIPEIDINDWQWFDNINVLGAKHGTPSTTNTISLGAQIGWANGTPGVYALETAPPVPRRISYVLKDSANGQADLEDLTFELPLNVTPDSNSNINFFVTDAATEVESQILPNKVPFYDPTITSNPSGFVFGAGYTYSYTVILKEAVEKSGDDGVLTNDAVPVDQATLSSVSVQFGLDDLSGTRTVLIQNATNAANNGNHTIISITEGVVTIEHETGGTFVTESDIEFQVLDSSARSARVLFTDDLVLALGDQLRATIVDERDADFYDAGWINAYAAAEAVDANMIVPLPTQTISAIFQNGKVHVEKMSNIKNKRERVLFIGAIQGLTPDNVMGTRDAAVEDIGVLEGIQGDDVSEILAGNVEDLANYGVQNAYGETFRVVYMFPDEIVVQIGADRTLVSGYFMAPALAGYLSADPNIYEPPTNDVLSGFTILRDKVYSPTVIENICAAGICLLQPVTGGGRIIWGKTTIASNVAEEEEISIVFIRDAIAKALRQTFDPFIGKAEIPTQQAVFYEVADKAFISFITRRWITDYTDVAVARDEVEPRQWNITAKAQPTYGVNWIYIRVDIGRLS
jgi:hypothetical protein